MVKQRVVVEKGETREDPHAHPVLKYAQRANDVLVARAQPLRLVIVLRGFDKQLQFIRRAADLNCKEYPVVFFSLQFAEKLLALGHWKDLAFI
jgi:hypothetical protein